jgi:hypothetical protein
MELYSFYLRHPFTMLISGPTGSGKTLWVKKLIDNINYICDKPPQRITYFYGEYQPIFSNFHNVNFIQGLPDNYLSSFSGQYPELVIIDDLMSESSKSELVSNLFTKGSHHRNLSIILITQNFFMRGKESRNITLNSHYIVLFKNPRDKSLASNIARQIYPNKIKKFQLAFEDATSKPFTYLFLDLKPDTPEEIRLSTNIFGELLYPIVYLI